MPAHYTTDCWVVIVDITDGNKNVIEAVHLERDTADEHVYMLKEASGLDRVECIRVPMILSSKKWLSA